MIALEKHLDLLGMRVKDRVTGFEGIVSSIAFDLFGCIQATVTPQIDKDGKRGESYWLDVNRLEVLSRTPVMERPEFEWSPQAIAEGAHGPSERPACYKE